MKKRVTTIIHKSTATSLLPLLLGTLVAGAALAGADDPEAAHAGHGPAAPAKLVQTVRNVTGQFTEVSAAIAAGYQPLFRLRQRSGSGGDGSTLHQPRST
jgi:hypothetical protein